jgi:hypothetical protein
MYSPGICGRAEENHEYFSQKKPVSGCRTESGITTRSVKVRGTLF